MKNSQWGQLKLDILSSLKLLALFGSKRCQAAMGKRQSSKPPPLMSVDVLRGNSSVDVEEVADAPASSRSMAGANLAMKKIQKYRRLEHLT